MLTRLLLIGALTFSSGCSLVLVDGPPDFIPPSDPIPAEACTVERVFPLLDALGAGAMAVTALTSDDGNAVRFGAVIGAGLGYSSYAGFGKVKQCRDRVFADGNGGLPVATEWPATTGWTVTAEGKAWTEGTVWPNAEPLPWTLPATWTLPAIPPLPLPASKNR